MQNESGAPWDAVDDIKAAWARELPDVPVDSIGVITRVWWSAKLLGDDRRRTLAKLGIDTATLDLLATLRRHGKPYSMTPGELAAACLVTSGAITQRVSRAMAAGLVARTQSDSGYHTQLVQLTDKGNELLERTVTELLDHEQQLIDHLTREEQIQLADLLRKLFSGLRDRLSADTRLGQVGDPT